jgi:hypothetical protein
MCKWKFNENVHLIVLNTHKRKEIVAIHRRNTHMDHENSPLSNMKMPKAKLMDTYLKNNPK